MIISVSRRSDIPRFYWDWFLSELERGETEVVNPFNAHQRKAVSLLPQDVDGFVFWTRDPYRIVASADVLREKGYQFYVMVSLTGYPPELEPHGPDIEKVILEIHQLKQLIGAERIFWRYDPIILSSLTTVADHERRFHFLATELQSSVSRCIISLYDPYKKSEKRLRGLEAGGKLNLIPLYTAANQRLSPEAELLVKRIAEIAHQYEIPLYSCAEPDWVRSYGITAHACVDGSLFGKQSHKDAHQRPFCLCDTSVDIGTYGTCPARCVYCYAW
uniref:DUF1848 domain-containing protein n=1 Tax=Gracilinema caldarium TaxID=215591 RepID=A0A7C3I6A5_9SPIR